MGGEQTTEPANPYANATAEELRLLKHCAGLQADIKMRACVPPNDDPFVVLALRCTRASARCQWSPNHAPHPSLPKDREALAADAERALARK